MGKVDWNRKSSSLPGLKRFVLSQPQVNNTTSGTIAAQAPLQGRAIIPFIRYGLRAVQIAHKASTTASPKIDIVAYLNTTTADQGSIIYTATAMASGDVILAHFQSAKCWRAKLRKTGGTEVTKSTAFALTFDSGGYFFSQQTGDGYCPSTHRGVVPALANAAATRITTDWFIVVDSLDDSL